MNIFVSNLCETVGEHNLRDLFGHFGTVVSLQIIMSYQTGQSQKFAFVVMATRNEGETAINELDNMQFMGRYLEVKEVREKSDR